MRVIFTGQTGTSKRYLADQIASFHKEVNGEEIEIYEVEEKANLKSPIEDFLDEHDDSWKRSTWWNSLELINTAANRKRRKPKHVFLLLHNFFYRKGRFFSYVNYQKLKNFKPDIFITLIDDIFDIWLRIKRREEQLTTRARFTLEELLLWRDIEIKATDVIATNLNIPHFVMSVKHSVKNFHRLIFSRNKHPLVYACIPISNTRTQPSRRQEIDRFRNAIAKCFTIVDPLTIDELRIQNKAVWNSLTELNGMCKFLSMRWPLSPKPSLGAPAIPPEELPRQQSENPCQKFSQTEIDNLYEVIWQQIIYRDFILVAQSNCLAAYRPFYPKPDCSKMVTMSGGMSEEISHACSIRCPPHHHPVHVVVFNPRSDYEPAQRSFWDELGWKAKIYFFPPLEVMKSLPSEDSTTGYKEFIEHLKNLLLPK